MIDPARPPAWADVMLRAVLPLRHRENVSGDLLEEYRDAIVPSRGRAAANRWYVAQVAWFVWRSSWLFGVLLAGSILGRDALDWWLSPTTDFYARSIVSTWIAASLFAVAGLRTASRSRSVAGGTLTGVAAGVVSAILVDAVSAGQLVLWHDAHTMAMIRASGGLEEVFVLPAMVLLPGAVCAAIGAAIGKMAVSVIGSHRLE